MHCSVKSDTSYQICQSVLGYPNPIYRKGHSSWGPYDEWRRPYGLRSIETHPWRGPPRPYETTARYVLPSPDNVPVQPSRLLRGTSHRKVSLVEYPAFEPLDLAQPIALFRLWRERRVGGTRYGNHTRNGLRYMLLEVSALGARDRLSTSHYRGRSPCPSRSPYEGGSPGVPSETWVRAVGDRWTPRSPRSFPTGLAVGGF